MIINGPIKWDRHTSVTGTQFDSATNLVKYSSLSTTTHTDMILMAGLPEYLGQDASGVDREEDLLLTQVDKNIKVAIKGRHKYTFRNNSSFPCKMHIWTLKDRINSNNTPTAILASAFDTEFGGDGGLETEPGHWPQQAREFVRLYRMSNHKFIELPPGSEGSYFINTPRFIYRPDELQNQSTTYRKGISRHMFLRLEGVIAHDQASTGNVGIAEAQVDILQVDTWRFAKIGGLRIPRSTFSDNLDTLTTSVIYEEGGGAKEEIYGD